jgi:Ca-activated chloride channel family protein
LPDLFHGGQLVVLGRYSGKGHAAVTLHGTLGSEPKDFVYEVNFPDKTADEKGFVEHLWARRKVGYLLDQIRANGEKKELVDEVVTLAKRYGIATPYTSYLIVPDGPLPVVTVRPGRPDVAFHVNGPTGGAVPAALAPESKAEKPHTVADFARQNQQQPGGLRKNRGEYEDKRLKEELSKSAGKDDKDGARRTDLQAAAEKKQAYDEALLRLRSRDREAVQAGKLGVDLSVQSNNLRNQSRMEQTAQRKVAGRNLLEIGGVWIDEDFDAKMTVVTVKAMSDAYFRILELHPKVKEVFKLGNHLVWVAPNGAALVLDTNDGKEKMKDEEINKLFIAKKK